MTRKTILILKIITMLFLVNTIIACDNKNNANIANKQIEGLTEGLTLEDIAVSRGMSSSGTLKVETIDGDMFNVVKTAEYHFREKYPGWKIEVMDHGRYDAFAEDEKPDVLYMPNVRNQATFSSENVSNFMEDLTPWMEYDEEFDTSNILPGVLDAMGYGQGPVYAVPVNFVLNRLFTIQSLGLSQNDKTTLLNKRADPWTWDALIEFSELEMARLGLKYILNESPQVFVVQNYIDYYFYFYNENEKTFDFNTPLFKEIVALSQKLYNQGLLLSVDSIRSQVDTFSPEALFYRGSMGKYVTDYSVLSSQGAYTTPNSVVFPVPIIDGLGINKDNRYISFMDEYGIDVNSNNKEAAWEFIKFLISDDVQNIRLMSYNPIINELSRDNIMYIWGLQEVSDEDYIKYNNERREYYTNIDCRDMSEVPKIGTILEKCLTPFFKGEVSFEQMTNELQIELDELNKMD